MRIPEFTARRAEWLFFWLAILMFILRQDFVVLAFVLCGQIWSAADYLERRDVLNGRR